VQEEKTMNKFWLNSYPQGAAHEIDIGAIPSLVQMIEQSCAQFADKTAYISMGKTMSYRQLGEDSQAFAAWLQAIGVAPGDRVALMMPNLLQYPVALFGALRAGCTAVNCNPLYTPRELEYQLKDSGATVIVILENFAHTLEQVIDKTAIRHVVVTPVGEMLGLMKGALVNFALQYVKRQVPGWTLPGSLNLTQALDIGRRHHFVPPVLTHDDIAFLQYTGGTTGVSKAAMLTHGNMVANVSQARAWIAPMVHEGDDLILTALPLYHIFALTANCLTFMLLGARNLLIANPRDIPTFIKEWSRYPVSVITGVNTLFNALLNHPEFSKLDFSTLKFTLGGGMAVTQAVADRWVAVTGKAISQAYGLTETSPAAIMNPLHVQIFNGSIGLPIASTEVAIRDDRGADVPIGQVGEVTIRGPQVMKGYWNRPDETAHVFYADGFLRTGDLGYISETGFVYLVDRKKDMILVSGFNVYPNEVEAAIALHPGVIDVAAVGVPDAHSGEAVKVFVVRKDPALTEDALISYCRTQLTGYKVPRHVEFRDDLPRTNVGKVLRRALKDDALRSSP
jgi:long-chain acyl-CoA synthetase